MVFNLEYAGIIFIFNNEKKYLLSALVWAELQDIADRKVTNITAMAMYENHFSFIYFSCFFLIYYEQPVTS